MSQPTFTVVMATHNRRELLLRAVRSVLNQTCGDFELLVIDNGSTDDTAAAMQSVTDSRVRFLRNEPPTASCDAPRNLGIRLARAPFISFLDDDDYWYPERLAKVKRAFEEHPEEQAVCHYEHQDTNGTVDRLHRHGPWTEHFFESLLYERNCLSPCAITIRAGLLRELGGFTLRKEMDGVADYDLWLRMAARGVTIRFLEEPLGVFCANDKNWSVVDAGTQSRLAFIVREHILAYERQPLRRVSTRGLWRLFQMYYLAGRSFLRGGQLWDALRYYGGAARCVAYRPALVGRVASAAARRIARRASGA